MVKNSDIIINNPSELIIVIPELVPGIYKLEVMTQSTNNVLLKEPRKAVFDKLPVVQ